MKVWILVMAAVALLVWSLARERFKTYEEALADVGQTAGTPPVPMCPAGTILRDEDELCVSQSATATPQCPSGYQLRADTKCQRNGGTETTDPSCAAGFEFNTDAQRCDTTPVEPTCPGDYTYIGNGTCERKASATPAPTPASATPDPSPASAPASAPASTTTGGSSTSTWGPTSGGTAGGASKRLRQVFGPQFTERGNEVRSDDGDSSQTNVYPELLGGVIDSSSRIPGAGIQAPSKNWTMSKDGTLPTSKSLGSDAMSQFFPFSRSPGDMDIIPDPYRVAKTFSTSSYSSKTEPVPFLTDFSAFQK
jgi:hypothetical protein